MLSLKEITKSYKIGPTDLNVLNGITVTVERGDLLAIIGRSGSGKSTLMNIIGLLDRPTTGTYIMDDAPVNYDNDGALSTMRNRKIGFVFQQYHLLPRLNALENVELPLVYRGTKEKDRKARARELLAKVQMDAEGVPPTFGAIGWRATEGGNRALPCRRPLDCPRRRADGRPGPEGRPRDHDAVSEAEHGRWHNRRDHHARPRHRRAVRAARGDSRREDRLDPMVIKANFREALRSLFSSKQRSLLALIGIVIGIGSVIGMVSIGGIVQSEAMRQFRDMGVEVVTIRKGFGRGEGPAAMAGADTGFRLEDATSLPLSIPSLAEVAPFSEGGSRFTVKGKEEYVNIFGVTASFFSINRLKIASGRAVTDLDRYSPFCVIGSEMADKLKTADRSRIIGTEIKLGDNIFTIAGLMAPVPDGGGMRPPNLNKAVLIHATTASRAYPNNKITSIIARVRPGAGTTMLKQQVQAYFAARDRRRNVEVQTAEELIENMEKQMRLFTLLLGAIGSIALIVGGVGVMNVMLVSVTERRKEIGIRRALGAHREDVQMQFIIESVVLCLTGGLVGILIGVVISYLFAYFTKWEFMLSMNAVMLGIGVSSAVGVFFGYYPARQASRLDPIMALRGE